MLTPKTTHQAILKIFPNIDDRNLVEEIIKAGKTMTFERGAVIMDYGDYIHFVPMVMEGSIKVITQSDQGDEILLYYLTAGDSCAMSFSCCMMRKKSDIRTIADTDVTIQGIPVQLAEEWMGRYPSWRKFVMSYYDDRIRELINTLDSIAFKKLDARLLEYLEKKVSLQGSRSIHTTHKDISDDLHASREAVSRMLKKLEQQGIIKLQRNKIILLEKS